MNAVPTYFRSLSATLMLIAMMSFVMHQGAAAIAHGHGPGTIAHHIASGGLESETPAAVEGHDDCVSRTHGQGDATIHVGHDGHHPAGNAADTELACCSSLCASAVALLIGSDAAAAAVTRAPALAPANERGSGIDPNGLKRPPRAADIG